MNEDTKHHPCDSNPSELNHRRKKKTPHLSQSKNMENLKLNKDLIQLQQKKPQKESKTSIQDRNFDDSRVSSTNTEKEKQG